MKAQKNSIVKLLKKMEGAVSDLLKAFGKEDKKSEERGLSSMMTGIPPKKKGKGRGKPLTEATIRKVENLLKKGMSAPKVAAKVGISNPSVYRIQKEMRAKQ